MNGIETIHLLWNLLAVWLPGAAVGAMIVCTVLLIRRDRYCRKLALAESPEAAEIRALAASGAVTPEEAGKLLAGCNALPAVRETSPLPDLPLKLVSAFGRIYSTMKIVMLAGVFAAFRAVHLAASAPGFRGEYEYRAENLPLLLGVSGAVLILAVLEFIASVRLLHGSFAARNYLIFNWILNFLLIRCALAAFGSPLYFVPAVGAGAYALYVLAFRRGAVRKITAERPEPGRGGRLLTGVAAAAALAAGLCFGSAQYEKLNEFFIVQTNFSSSTGGPAHLEYEKILLIAGTPDPETAKLCELLAAALRAESGTVCEVRGFSSPVPVDDLLRVLPVLVSRREFVPPEPPLPGAAGKLLRLSLRELNPQAAEWNDGLEAFAGRMKDPLCFRLETLTGSHSASFRHKGILIPEGGLSFNGTFLAGSSLGGRRRPLDRLAVQMVRSLRPLRQKRSEEPGIRLPELPLPEVFPVEADFSEFPGLVRLFTGHSLQYGVLAVYRFNLPDAGNFDRLVASLEAQGFERRSDSFADGRIRFEKGDELRIDLYGENRSHFGEIGSRSPFGMLICCADLWRRKAEGADMEFLRRFAGSDPRSFAMADGIRNLPDAEIPAAFDRLAASGKLTRRQKLHLLRNLSGEKCRRALGERYAVFYRQLEDEILDDFADPGYMGAVGDLLSCTREDPARHEALLARLAPIRATLKLPETPNENGEYVLKARLRRMPFVPSRLLLDLETPGRPPLRLSAALSELPDGTLRVDAMNSSRQGIRPEELGGYHFDAGYGVRRDGGNWEENGWSSSASFLPPGGQILPGRPRPGQLNIRLRFEPGAGEYLIGVIYAP